jgi:hypothetical protein
MTDKEIKEYHSRTDYREWWEIQAVKLIEAATRPVYVGCWIFFILDCLGGAFYLQAFTVHWASFWGSVLINWLVGLGLGAAVLWVSLLLMTLIYDVRLRNLI